jgi:RimJ/RimL family protein N-acetyltransferase
MNVRERYPRSIEHKDGSVLLRLMTAGDEPAVLGFAEQLPAHDLLFLRRDITQPKVLSAWVRDIETDDITSLLALEGERLVGCTAVVRDQKSWSPHVGDVRVLISPAMRAQGLGRVLIQECFLIALGLGLEKVTAHMTADQVAAIGVFESMGFTPEALLRDHVRDRSGVKHDVVILGHDVAAFQARMHAYGLLEAF